MLDDDPSPKLATLQASLESTITGNNGGVFFVIKRMLVTILLCCPVLMPQMTGDPTFPGDDSEKVSEVQSPTADPVR